MSNTINNRYDFVLFFDVKDGNPNGDPDAGNLPRVDPETGQGLVTDVCLKRKVRNYIAQTNAGNGRYRLFVRDRSVLNPCIEEAYFQSEEVKEAIKKWDETAKKKPKKGKAAGDSSASQTNGKERRVPPHIQDIAAKWMCDNFFDIRFFGAVLNTGDAKEHPEIKSKIKMTAGQVRGPIQFGFARSIDPIFSAEHAITRVAVTNEDDFEKKEREMGRKFTVPYGLYRVHGFFNPFLADQTGFSADDLELFKRALGQMFEFDRSAARGQMVPRRCIAFRHETSLGNARADQLFDRVQVTLKNELADAGKPPRKFDDYDIQL